MADDILDELEDDFDDDMSDILADEAEEASEDENSQKGGESRKNSKTSSLISSVIFTVKGLLSKILVSKKAIIIVVAGIVVLICTALVLWLFVFSNSPDDALQPKQVASQTDVQGTPEDQQKIEFEDIVELEPFERIKLKTSSTMGMISLELSLELTDARYRKQIYSMEDRIRTIVTQQVENATWLELRNPEGKIMLKYNLLQRINAIFPKATVRNVYFTYFIMQ